MFSPVLRDVLSQFPAASTLQSCQPVAEAGFSGAGVWRLETLAGPFALRRWPDDGPPADRLWGLHALLRHLQRNGVNFVGVPVPNHEGSTLVRIDRSWWQLEPWLPGVADFARNPSPRRLTAAMQGLACWHSVASSFVAETGSRAWFLGPANGPAPAIVERTVKLRDMLGRIAPVTTPMHLPDREWRDAFDRLLAGCHSRGPALLPRLEQACAAPVPLQICLRDVWHDHVLFTGDTVTGLIDPSAARIDTIATDLARLLGSFVGDGAEAWEFAINAYHDVRPLPAAERRLIPLLDQSGVVLSAWTWIERLSQSSASTHGSPRLLQRLRVIAGRLEHAAKRLVVSDDL